MPRGGIFLVKAITPKAGIHPKNFDRLIDKTLKDEGEIIVRQYKKVVRTWRHKVDFKVRVGRTTGRTFTKNAAFVTVSTDDKIFGYVDQGTKSRSIRPRRKKYLKFRVGGKPKTKRRVIGSSAGSAGTKWVTTKLVRRHKIEAREFSVEIKKRRAKPFYANMKKAITQANHKAFK